MKRIMFQPSLFFAVLLATAQLAHADWQQTGGIRWKEQDIRCFAVSGGKVFAGTADNGVFVSGDNGANWSTANTGLTTKMIRCFAVSGGNVFAGTMGGTVFLSTDNGANWTSVGAGLPLMVSSFAVSGTNLFAIADTGTVFRSTDNGANWTPANTGLAYSASSLTVGGAGLFAATFYGVYRSTDNGANWTLSAGAGLGPYMYFISVTASGTDLFSIVTDTMGTRTVFRSTDNGAIWTQANTGLPATSTRFLVASGTNLFAGTGSGVFLTTDNGANWARVNAGLRDTSVVSLEVSGTNLFAGTNTDGVFRSTDNGANWTSANTGLSFIIGADVLSLAASGSNILAGMPEGVYLSADEGASWTKSNTGLEDNSYVNTFAVSGERVFAGTGWGVFLTTNDGASWNSTGSGLINGTIIQSLVVSGTDLCAGYMWAQNRASIFHAPNEGANWVGVNMVDGNYNTFATVAALAASGTNLFAGTLGFGIFISTDGGASWNAMKTGLNKKNVWSFAVCGNRLFAGADSVFVTSDNGVSWSPANQGLNRVVDEFAVCGKNLFAATDNGVFLSTDNGTSWGEVNQGLLNRNVTSLAIGTTYLFAGTKGGIGVWRRRLSEMITIYPAPTVASVSPSSGMNNSPLQITNINGTNFRSGATVKFVKTGQADITATGVSVVSATQIACTVDISGAASGKWDVVIVNDDFKTATLSQSFTVFSTPGTPILISPSERASDVSIQPVMFWNKASAATSYHLQVASDSLLKTIVFQDSTIADTSRSCTELANDSKYFWRVRASNTGGTGMWSSVHRFTTIVDNPPVISLKSPKSGDEIKCDSVYLMWSKGTPKIDRYWLEYSSDSLFKTPIRDSTLTDTDTFKVLRDLHDGDKIWWRVKAHNASGWGSWSDTNMFMVRLPVLTRAEWAEIPKAFSFKAANSSETIRYSLPRAEQVTLRLYEINGRMQTELINKLQAAGYYSLNLQRGSIAAGTYLAVFKAGTFDKKTIVILLK